MVGPGYTASSCPTATVPSKKIMVQNYGPQAKFWTSKITVHNRSLKRSKITVHNRNFGQFKMTVPNSYFGRSKITVHNRNFGRSKITFHNCTFGWFKLKPTTVILESPIRCWFKFGQPNKTLFQIYGFMTFI